MVVDHIFGGKVPEINPPTVVAQPQNTGAFKVPSSDKPAFQSDIKVGTSAFKAPPGEVVLLCWTVWQRS